jgi:SAM-dependent methyltransferase
VATGLLPLVRHHRGYPYLPDFWEHYTKLPAIYHRFAISTDAGVGHLQDLHDLSGKRVLDVAAGTGRSALAMARFAKSVVAVEPDPEMYVTALSKQRELAIENVQLMQGSTQSMPPLAHHAVDIVTSFHGPPFFLSESDDENSRNLDALLHAMSQFVAHGGLLAFVMAIPEWRHAFLQNLPHGTPGPMYDPGRRMEAALLDEGFRFSDATLDVDYGTLEEALATYGFIYGPLAVDWLLATRSAVVPWGNRIYLREAS